MSTRTAFLSVLVFALGAFGCDNLTPTAPDLTAAPSAGIAAVSSLSAASAAVRTPISGSFDLVGFGDLECRETPAAVVQCRGGFAETSFVGDLDGTVVFTYQTDKWQWSDEWFHETAGGRFAGTVTWNSLTGMIDGTWATECKPHTACRGTMIAHGSDDLAGVKFQIKWSGLWPMAYEGFALDPHGR